MVPGMLRMGATAARLSAPSGSGAAWSSLWAKAHLRTVAATRAGSA